MLLHRLSLGVTRSGVRAPNEALSIPEVELPIAFPGVLCSP